jgi:integrase
MVAGHLREIKGYYYIVLSYLDCEGKRRTPTKSTGLSVKGNKRKAEKMLVDARIAMTEELEQQAAEKSLCEKNKQEEIFFTQFMRDWLDMKQTTVELSTFVSYKSAVEKFIIPYFDNKHPSLKLSEISAKHIQDYYTYELKTRKISNNTVKHRHATISNALKYAMRMDLIPGNPASKVELPRLSKYSASYYNEKELGALFDLVKGTSLELGVYLSAYYGLRRSEAVGLRWDAIDFDRKTITIKHTAMDIYADGQHYLVLKDRTKTKSSYRTLPLVVPFEELLLRIKAEQETNRKLCGNCYCNKYLDYIYVNELGELMKPDYLSTKLPRFLEEHNMRRIRFHDLRHSCASLLLANGVSLKDIQSWLGHSTISTTANIYVHQEFASKINSANAILQVLPGTQKEGA